MNRFQKVAIVMDSLLENGGDVRVLRSLLKIFPQADIVTAVADFKNIAWLKDRHVKTSFIQKLPPFTFWSRHFLPLSPIAFEQFTFHEYDLVISLSAGCAKGIITTTETLHLGVILTPPRYQWDGRQGKGIPIIRPIIDSYIRVWDSEASLRPDILISISKYIQSKVTKLYRRESIVVYPGVDTTFWTPVRENAKENFYVVVSRLRDYKRIDIAIQACENLKRKLIVIGDGPEAKNLQTVAGPHTTFFGNMSDEKVRQFVRKAKAFLFPGIEDFGLAPLEALSCGTPVIAFNGGGFPETMIDQITGILCEEQTVECFAEALTKFEKMKWDSSKIAKHAHEFSEKAFLKSFKSVLDGYEDNKYK